MAVMRLLTLPLQTTTLPFGRWNNSPAQRWMSAAKKPDRPMSTRVVEALAQPCEQNDDEYGDLDFLRRLRESGL